MIIAPASKAGNLLAISENKLGGGDFAKLASFPGFFKWEGRNARFRSTGQNLAHVLRHWPEAQWVGGAEAVRDEYLAQQAVATKSAKAKDTSSIDDKGYKYKRPPMAHQRRAFAISRDMKAFALLMEQGTGKTKVALDTACWLWQRKQIDALIVVAWPNGVHRNWVEYEIPEDVSAPYVADYWSGNHATKHRTEDYNALFTHAQGRLKIFCFNVEAFVSQPARALILRMLREWRCLLVIDQSASIKNPQAKRTKFLIDKCSELAPYRRVLDGQPVAEGANELYSQFKFLDPWIIGHDTWTAFKAEFCKIGFFNEIIGYQNLDVLRKRIDPFSFRVRSDDCLDLPPRIYKPWVFELGPNERRIFDELKVQDLATFGWRMRLEEDAETLEEHNALVKNMRLQQISSGWWPKDKETKQIEPKLPSRANALLSLIDGIGKDKALIYARFRADLALLATLLGSRAVSYHGGIREDDRDVAKRRFMDQKSGVQFFIGQPRSAGFGHTLTAAKHVIFYSNDHSLRMREECEKRAHRQGLKHKLIVWDLIAKATQDRKILRAFRTKKELANVILQDPTDFFLHYDDE